VNWVLDIDIRGFFDHLDHEWLMKFIEYRIADPRILRLLRKWMTAGVIEDGEWKETEEGSPQGAVISPLLSNIYLHHVLDQWTDQWRQTATGEVTIVRYADDAIIGFQHQAEAERYLRELREQLQKHGLELNETKTRLIEFGRHAENDRQKRGAGKPETFTFLGMQHVCSQNGRGSYEIRRITDGKRRRKKLQEIKQQLRQRMHEKVATVGQWLRSVLTGYYNYHAVPGNIDVLSRFRHQVVRLWHHTLGRRSQQRPSWEQTGPIFDYWLPTPKVKHPYPDARFYARRPRAPHPR
jgi:group II intron reverse transcriptase/maturase